MNNNFKMTVDRLDAQLAQMEELCSDTAESLKTILNALGKVPKPKVPGHLVKSACNGYVRWKQVINAEETRSGMQEIRYLGEKDQKLLQQLAWKLYLDCSLRVRSRQQKAVQASFRKLVGIAERNKYGMRIIQDPDILKLLGLDNPLPEKQQAWQAAEYPHNLSHPESLCIHAEGDWLVRSKSEALIVSELIRMHIAFRYECALQLQNMTVYPDFTIMHPATGEIYYWEHFGMMDDNNYATYAGRKLEAYVHAGYLPMDNLILTYETREHPLDYKEIRKVIECYFLSE